MSKNSTSFHQRILFPTSGKHSPPRILHSPAYVTLDPLLLDLIALICREHVLNWYSNISKDPDRSFIRQITSIIVHVIQALELRLVQIDLVELFILDFPSLLERHVIDFDLAINRASTGHAHNLSSDSMFHYLQPHIAISLVASPSTGILVPEVDKIYLRALVDQLLGFILPPEDYRAETERAIVKEIIVNIILGSVFDKVAQPWFLYQIIAKLLESREGDQPDVEVVAEKTPLSSKAVQEVNSIDFLNSTLSKLASIPPFLHAIFVTISTIYRTIISSPLPSHYPHQQTVTTPLLNLILAILPTSTAAKQFVHYLQFLLTLFSTFINALIFHLLNEKVFNAELVETGLEVTIKSLFPDGHPSPKEEDPNEEEKEGLRIRCEEALARSLPSIATRLFPLSSSSTDSPKLTQDLLLARHLLRPLSSHVANVQLFVLVLDLIVGKLFPEMVVAEDSQ